MEKMLQALLEGGRPDLNALVGAFGVAVPSLYQLKETEQDPEWHGEGDVHIHTQMVLDELYREFDSPETQLERWEKRELILGVLFHDLAKPFTTRRVEVKGVERVTARGHEEKGRSILATALCDKPGLPWRSLWSLMGLVGSHHEPKLLIVREKTPGEYKRISRRVNSRKVSFLERADMRGRTCPDKKLQLEHIELFEMYAEEYALPNWERPYREHLLEALRGRSPVLVDRVYGETVRLLQEGRISSPEEGGFLLYQEPPELGPPELVILCGPSGSGKSSFTQKHLSEYTVVSLDEIREELSGKKSDQSMNGEVLQEARKRLKENLRPGKRVVWDATNLRKDFRSQVIQTGYDYKALVTLVVFQLSLEGYSKRNSKRRESVSTGVLESQIERWEFPEPDEAHRMLVLNGTGQVRGAMGFCDPENLPWGLEHAR